MLTFLSTNTKAIRDSEGYYSYQSMSSGLT